MKKEITLRVYDDKGVGIHFKYGYEKPTKARIEYAIDYLTSTGKKSKKVFQIREKIMQPDTQETISRFQRFANLTTRKHFPGHHKLSILLNGKEVASASFQVK